MIATLELPLPRLSEGRFASVTALSDSALYEACGVRIAFSKRVGGVSEGAFESLNLGQHVGDDAAAVNENRRILTAAFNAERYPCIVPKQVHGTQILTMSEGVSRSACEARAQEGVDAIVVEIPRQAALLCFADCVPVIMVSPSGRFAVVHAGWRGLINGVISAAFKHLLALEKERWQKLAPRDLNLYIGPYIHAECFETGEEVAERFSREFGSSCLPNPAMLIWGARCVWFLRASVLMSDALPMLISVRRAIRKSFSHTAPRRVSVDVTAHTQ